MIIAITREVSPDIGNCELTHVPPQEINIEAALLKSNLGEKSARF